MIKPDLVILCSCFLAACAAPGLGLVASGNSQASAGAAMVPVASTKFSAPGLSSQATALTSVSKSASATQTLFGQATLNGRIDLTGSKAGMKTQAAGLRTQQVNTPQFGVRVYIQNCDDLLAQTLSDGNFRLTGLPQNVPLDVDVYDLSQPLLQLRAQITLRESESTLVVQARSTALALLYRFLRQNQSPTQGIPDANFENDSQLSQAVLDLTVNLQEYLGQETLRSLQYQIDWNRALANLQSRLEALIQARPALLQLSPVPLVPSVQVSTSPSSGPTGGGSSPTSNDETAGGTINLEGL